MRRKRDLDLAVRLVDLTERERTVAAALALGLTNHEIAAELHISPKTVDTHRAHVLEKICARNNVELARRAIAQGFVSAPAPDLVTVTLVETT